MGLGFELGGSWFGVSCEGMGSYALREKCCTCGIDDDCDDEDGDDDDDYRNYNIVYSNINDNSVHKTKQNKNNYTNQPSTLNLMLHIPSSRGG